MSALKDDNLDPKGKEEEGKEPVIYQLTPEGRAAREKLANQEREEWARAHAGPLTRGMHPDSGPDSLAENWEENHRDD